MSVHKLLDHTFTTAESITAGDVFHIQQPVLSVCLQAILDYGSSGTTIDAYVQTSLDGGVNWGDIANFHFTTADAVKTVNLSALTPVTTQFAPDDGAIANDTCKDGFLGQLFRVKRKSTGTYAGNTNLKVYASFKAALIG